MPTVTGTNLGQLDYAIKEFINPGQRAELLVGVDRELSSSEVASIEAYMRSKGLSARVDFGFTENYPNALRVQFTRPSKFNGNTYGFLPLLLPPAAIIIGAIGAVGTVGLIGFKLGNVLDSIAKHLVPLAVIGVGAVVAINLSKAKS